MTWGRIKEKLERGGDGGLGRSHVWLTTSAFACIGEKKRQPAAWHGSFTTREMYTTFSPLSIPQFQNWEQFPSPPTLSEEGPERVRKLATFQPYPSPKPRPPTRQPLARRTNHRTAIVGRRRIPLGTRETTRADQTEQGRERAAGRVSNLWVEVD